MLRFASLQRAGLRVAAMTDKAEPNPAAVLGDAAPDVVTVKQVHGAHIVAAESIKGDDERVEADGITVATAGLPIAVNVADCVPVLLFEPERKVAAAVHAGRRGLEAGIVAKALEALAEIGGATERVHAAIGPSAGPCCYEVSETMAEAWVHTGLPSRGRLLDLWEAARQQLVCGGVDDSQIDVCGVCTICGDRFYSYRRGDEQPRNLAVLMM